jgi:hypothetical protein
MLLVNYRTNDKRTFGMLHAGALLQPLMTVKLGGRETFNLYHVNYGSTSHFQSDLIVTKPDNKGRNFINCVNSICQESVLKPETEALHE